NESPSRISTARPGDSAVHQFTRDSAVETALDSNSFQRSQPDDVRNRSTSAVSRSRPVTAPAAPATVSGLLQICQAYSNVAFHASLGGAIVSVRVSESGRAIYPSSFLRLSS